MAVKGEGKPNDLMERVAQDPAFEAVHGEKLSSLIDPALFIGRSPEQVICAFRFRCSRHARACVCVRAIAVVDPFRYRAWRLSSC